MKDLRATLIYTMCAALLVVSKEMLAFLPNVELVSFLLIIFALHFRLAGCIWISVLFSFIQTILYGVGTWTPMYFIVWTLLVCVVYVLRPILKSDIPCACFSGLFGLSFGLLFAIPYFLMSIQTGVAYYLRGIPYDLIHGIANFLLMLVLFNKVNQVLAKLASTYKL